MALLTFCFAIQRRYRTGVLVGLIAVFLALPITAVADASNGRGSPLPFSGTFQSLGSEARERSSREKDSWVTIPQNVFLNLVKDDDIVELQLKIEVLDDAGRVLYPIQNRMWLRSVAGNRLEVYKLNKTLDNFEQVGDGACTAALCSYQYVILAQNNGNPYKQRYTSTISWNPEDIERGFNQSGSLSAEVIDESSGQKNWFVFKTWTNQFEELSDP